MRKIIYVVMFGDDSFEPSEIEMAFATKKQAEKYVRDEMQDSPIPEEDWEEFYIIQEVELVDN